MRCAGLPCASAAPAGPRTRASTNRRLSILRRPIKLPVAFDRGDILPQVRPLAKVLEQVVQRGNRDHGHSVTAADFLDGGKLCVTPFLAVEGNDDRRRW